MPNRPIHPSAVTQAPATTEQPHRGLARFSLDITRAIGGRKFNTATATLACIITRAGHSQQSDFHYERTGLYRSARGQWFVAGKGGACSHWGRRAIDGSRDPGEGLQRISQTQARRLLEQHGGPVEAFFKSEEG